MEKEFNLSKKIREAEYSNVEMIRPKDVKEFIKRLKESKVLCGCKHCEELKQEIDKLAGSELVK